MIAHYYRLQDAVMALAGKLSFSAPLLLRLYLAPIMIAAGLHKYHNFEDIVAWFGNPDWGLGLPAPALMAGLATATEIIGGVWLLLGLATRWVALPLMFTMAVAAGTAHWDNGWFAIAPSNPATSAAKPLADFLGLEAAKESLANSEAVGERLERAKSILREHGNYSWLSSKGSFVVLNNGIEFAATYFIMLLVLFFSGGGALSVDYLLSRIFPRPQP